MSKARPKFTLFTTVLDGEPLLPYWLEHHRRLFDHGVITLYPCRDNSEEIIKDSGLDKWPGIKSYIDKTTEYENSEFMSSGKHRQEINPDENTSLRDFYRLTQIIMTSCGFISKEVRFYKKDEDIRANFGGGVLSWNVFHIQKDIDTLTKVMAGQTTELEEYNFFRKILDDITHEMSHYFAEGKASHESAERLIGLFISA